MSIGENLQRIKGNITAALAAIADKGVTVPDGSNSDALAGLIASIEVGGSDDGSFIKAFETQPLGNEYIRKCIAPIINITYKSAYTNSADEISISFTYGNVGDTHLAIFALRGYTEIPEIPDGWECIEWVEPVPSDANYQSLLILRHTVLDGENGTSATIGLSVLNGVRNYGIVLNLGDTNIDDSEKTIFAQAGIANITPELYEQTLLVCSTATTSTTASSDRKAWITTDGGYMQNIMPAYNDSSASGGRLACFYIPHKNQQPFEIPNFKVNENGNNSTSVIYCAFKLNVGTPSKYAAILDVE